ncbi:hypothetical protein PV325_000574 [Microctonus aethiopoides]|uniref:Cytochrome P450 n=1 Tax=Microctonus aethiopoides TaxID=144406 RepID=A0AA39FXM3_9HYME|nr:hypothetical protein PV326_005693 [Microctonus aethiopoides]KAK0087627.1 hypothetical protein PV325_000574 [Microctonus aethiopoides]KAK0177603.1 hypothetical protein PV328_001640 [Microctonus aethiopoides]
MFIVFGLCILTIVWIFYLGNCWKPIKFPPGPRWLPFVGCFLRIYKLKKQTHYYYLVFNELSKIYGPILGLKLGKQKFVIISGNHLIKKTLMKHEFNGRPESFFFKVRSFGKNKGLLFADGSSWHQIKRTTIKILSSFGTGYDSIMNKCLKTEAEMMVVYLKNKNIKGESLIAINEILNVAITNVLWTMIAGHRFNEDDPKLHKILKAVHEAFRTNDTLGGIVSHLPILRFIIPELSGYNNLMAVLQTIWIFIGEEIDDHLETLKINEQPNNLIDAFLLELSSKDSLNSSFDREELIVLCMDIFMAGIKTTTDSLIDVFALLLHHSEWIKILQSDLDEVVGRKNFPAVQNKILLPRVDAFITEAHRVMIHAPLGLPHRTKEDVSLEGYHIPKDTVVLFNFYSAHNDSSCWDKPEEFCPERFLDENGVFRWRNELMIFGLGRRRCIGDIIAKPLQFLFFTSILHHFDIGVPAGHELPRLDGIDGFTVSPWPYLINLTIKSSE